MGNAILDTKSGRTHLSAVFPPLIVGPDNFSDTLTDLEDPMLGVAGVRWWFKYRDEPAFELPPSFIDKYHNNVLSIRDVMEYWAEHRE